jgi:oxygen-independent coproporphyrinogen-3 oxidase
MKNGSLHRNFMGYTSGKTKLMIGLGMSSIGDSWYGFSQNLKTVAEYENTVNEGRLPLLRGHILSTEDLLIRQHILNIMCRFETDWSGQEQLSPIFDGLEKRLQNMTDDGLLKIEGCKLKVTEPGIPFVRNICMQLDAKLLDKKIGEKMFSKTV